MKLFNPYFNSPFHEYHYLDITSGILKPFGYMSISEVMNSDGVVDLQEIYPVIIYEDYDLKRIRFCKKFLNYLPMDVLNELRSGYTQKTIDKFQKKPKVWLYN